MQQQQYEMKYRLKDNKLNCTKTDNNPLIAVPDNRKYFLFSYIFKPQYLTQWSAPIQIW
jgi:hypothetical protein